jgi:hypothetical protein
LVIINYINMIYHSIFILFLYIFIKLTSLMY